MDRSIRVDDERQTCQTFVRFHIKGTAVYAKECENAKSAHFTALGAGVRAWHESARNHSHPAAAAATGPRRRSERAGGSGSPGSRAVAAGLPSGKSSQQIGGGSQTEGH